MQEKDRGQLGAMKALTYDAENPYEGQSSGLGEKSKSSLQLRSLNHKSGKYGGSIVGQ